MLSHNSASLTKKKKELECIKTELIHAQSELIFALYDASQTQEQYDHVAKLTLQYVKLNRELNAH